MSENSDILNKVEETAMEPPEASLGIAQSEDNRALSQDSPASGSAESIPQEIRQELNPSDPPLDEDSEEEIGIVRTKKRNKILSDNSDSDDEKENNAVASNGRVSPLDEELEGLPDCEKSDESDEETTNALRHKNLKLLCDDDSSEDDSGAKDKESNSEDDFSKNDKRQKDKKGKKKERKRQIDDNEESGSDGDIPEEFPKKGKRKSQKKEKPKKMTKREKDEEEAKRSEIYSMIQKNAREEVIEVPYNKPEQYDLKEFLSRLQERKLELPIDKKLAKKTGKLRALKTERISVTEEIVKKIDSVSPESSEQQEDNSTEEKLAEIPDDLDLLVAGPSKEMTNPSNSAKKLTLQGDPNSMIDLDSGLVVPKSKPKEITLIEKCLSLNAKSATPVDTIKVENTPGVAYKILMESLQQELLRKKREQMQKYIEEQKKEEITKMANEIDDEAEFADSETDEEEIEKEENLEGEQIQSKSKDENDEDRIEKENENSDEEAEAEDNDGSDEDSETEETSERNKKFRKRIVNVDDDSNDEEQEKLTLPPLDGNILLPNIEHNNSVTESQMEDAEMELFDLCTGKFETQPPQSTNLPRQLGEDTPQEAPNSPQEDQEVHIAPNFDSSDDETPAQEKPTKKKSRKARVYLSDDEEKPEDETAEPEEVLSEVPELSDEECPKDTENLAYDSEENEIDSTALPVKPKIKVTDFMEDEAELSESEWGSADEDEKDLDKLDIELGDEDQFDQNQLQAELERIHMKKLLDQDAREVKMVKDIVLHEEEREGMIRERAFRWLHVNNEVNLNGDQQTNPLEDVRESDEEDEEAWRKMRHERDVVLKDQLQGEISGLFETGNVTILKPHIPENPKEAKAPTFLVPERDNLNRKSLLLQDEEYLARLATLASKTTDVLINGATEKGSFVFRQMAKEDNDPETSAGKRKPDNVLAPLKGKKRKKTSIYG